MDEMMYISRALAIPILVCAAGIGLVQPLWANPPDTPPPAPSSIDEAADRRARELYLQGDADYAAGRYEQAALRFAEAYELSRKPLLLFALANAYERIGDYARAAEYLGRYLESPSAHNVDAIRERMHRLEAAAQTQRAANPIVRGTEATTTQPGTPQSNAILRDATQPGTLPTQPAAQPPMPGKSADSTAASSSRAAYWWLAGSAAATGSALTFGLLSRSQGSQAAQECATTQAGVICTDAAAGALERERRYAVIADASAAAALLTMGVGLYLLTADRASAATTASARVAPLLTPHAAGLEFGGEF